MTGQLEPRTAWKWRMRGTSLEVYWVIVGLSVALKGPYPLVGESELSALVLFALYLCN
jgi:hypothetical protein